MAASILQQSAPSTSGTVSLTGVTAGSTLVLLARFASENRSITQCNDTVNGTNSWTVLTRVPSNAATLQFAYRTNTAAGAVTVTPVFDLAASLYVMVLLEVTGVPTAGSFDAGAMSATSTVGTLTSTASCSPAATGGGLLIACAEGELTRAFNTPAGWTSVATDATQGAFIVVSKSYAAAGAQSVTFDVTASQTNVQVCGILAFQSTAAGGGGGTPGQLTAVVKDASLNVLTGRVVTWASSNTAIATVDSSGFVTPGLTAGTCTITATCEGITSNTSTVTVS